MLALEVHGDEVQMVFATGGAVQAQMSIDGTDIAPDGLNRSIDSR
jgi:hypothetical protein